MPDNNDSIQVGMIVATSAGDATIVKVDGDTVVAVNSKCQIGLDADCGLTVRWPDQKECRVLKTKPAANNYRWYTNDELTKLHLNGPFVVRKDGEVFRAYTSSDYIEASGCDVIQDSSYDRWEISFDGTTWTPVGVEES